MDTPDEPGSWILNDHDHESHETALDGASPWDAGMHTTGQTDPFVSNQHSGLNFLDAQHTPSGTDDVFAPLLESGRPQQPRDSKGIRSVPVHDSAPHPTGQEGGHITQKKSTRGRPGTRYESMIDPNLTEEEKKKARRLLSNRASAKRTRARKATLMSEMREKLNLHHEQVEKLEKRVRNLESDNKSLRQALATLQQQMVPKDGA